MMLQEAHLMRGTLNKKEIYVFVAVRMKSSRLPLKALADIHGKPLIKRLVDRINESMPLDRIILCTSLHPQDDAIQQFSDENRINCFRGHELDVMGRFLAAAKLYNAGTIARVTGDNPLTDPIMLTEMFQRHISTEAEYTYSNDLPVGTRVEIIDVDALSRIHSQLSDPLFSEYMTYMLNRPDKIRVLKVESPNPILKRPEISLTIDTPSDLELIRDIYAHFEGVPPSLEKIIKWLDTNPDKKVYSSVAPSVPPEYIDCSFNDDHVI